MSGCPGSRTMTFARDDGAEIPAGKVPSQLRQWPIQLHLISPAATYFQGADVVLAADCVPFAMGDFHNTYLKGKALAIACPKLDGDQEIYLEKVRGLIEDAKINTLTVVIMQVPCCRGLLGLALQALKESSRKIPVTSVIVSLQGEVLQEALAAA
jgi:hypothetical protein